MRDHRTGLVAGYREPRSAEELARFIEIAVLDGLGRTMSGGRAPPAGTSRWSWTTRTRARTATSRSSCCPPASGSS